LNKIGASAILVVIASVVIACVPSPTPSPVPSPTPSPTPLQTSDFSIRLLAEDLPAAELAALDLGELPLQEEPIVSAEDVVAYSRETHEIELTAEAYGRVRQLFASPVPVLGIPFVVGVGAERIYSGAFWTPASSISFDGVVICEPFDVDRHVIKIVLGYPSREAFTAKDPRSDPRILQSLAAAGRLK
jgi:hypothetical protein